MDSVRDALNKANLAIRKYYVTAANVGPGTSKDVLEGPRDDAIHAIMEFANAKRAAKEMKLTPYEEHCLSFMDAANTIAEYKTSPESLKDMEHYLHEGECHCGQHQTH